MVDGNNKGFWRSASAYLGFADFPKEEETTTGVEHRSTALQGVTPSVQSRLATDVNQDTALSLVPVYRSVSILSTNVSALRLKCIRQGVEIESSLLDRPDVFRPQSAFLEEVTTSLALAGNAFLRLYRDTLGQVTSIEVLNPHYVLPERDGRRVTYHYNGMKFDEKGIKHLALLRVPGAELGLSPITAGRRALAAQLDQRDYANEWFGKNDIPSGVLTSDQPFAEDDVDAAKDRWNATADGKVRVLGKGLSYQPIMLSPQDAQWIESNRFGVTDIARLYGIPVHKLAAGVDGNSMTYANLRDANRDFVSDTLKQYTLEIEAALTDCLPRGQRAEFDYSTLVQEDLATRVSAGAQAVSAGLISVEEWRRSNGYTDPMPAPPLQTKEVAPATND